MTAASTFALGVTQGGVDITSAVSEDGIEVRAIVNGARTCRYTYEIIGGGSIDLTALVGASVVVTVNTGGGAQTIFSGNINRTPSYHTDSRTLEILATDGWQEFLDGKTEAELEALIPNAEPYNEDLDGPRLSGMQQALALLSTTAEDAFIDRDGDFSVVSWSPKASGSEDGTVTVSNLRDVVPELVDADELINTVVVTYRHTFTRRVWNAVSFTWSIPHSWCDWSRHYGYAVPTKQEITQAASGTGWGIIGGIEFDGHPETFGVGSLVCGGGYVWILNDYGREQAIGAIWTGGQVFSVEGRETLTLTLTAATSVSAYGSHTGELNMDADTPYAADAVDADDNPTEPSGFTAYGTGGTQSYSDEVDTTIRQANIEAALARAHTLILDTHRRNRLHWTQLIAPTLDLGQTWTVTHPLATCRGVVTALTHRVNRTSAVTMATVSAFIGGGGSDDTLTAPTFTVQAPTENAPSAVTVETKIGNQITSDDYDTAWEQGSYFTTNVAYICIPPDCPTEQQTYPIAFRVLGPDISATARQAVELTGSDSYAVAIPATTITVSGGS